MSLSPEECLPATDDADDGKDKDDDECGDKARSIYEREAVTDRLHTVLYILYKILYIKYY